MNVFVAEMNPLGLCMENAAWTFSLMYALYVGRRVSVKAHGMAKNIYFNWKAT